MVGDPFENGFESDGCRYVQDGRTIGFVTGCLKIFPRRAFEASLGLRMNAGLNALFRLLSVESFDKCAPQQDRRFLKARPRTIRLEKVLMKTR